MLHGNHDLSLLRIAHQIHCAPEALDFARQHPVSQVAARGDLHGAEDREVDLAGADHGERLFGPEARGARQQGDGFFARVDEVWVLEAGGGIRAEAQDAVFGLQLDLDGGWDEGGGEHGHADAQIRIHAVFELLGCAPDDAFALGCGVALA